MKIKNIILILLIALAFGIGFSTAVNAKNADYNANIKEIKTVKPVEDDSQAEYLYYFNMAKAYEHEKAFDKAIESYKLAIKANPDAGIAYSNLGVIYAETGDYKNSVEVFKKYLNIANDPEKEEMIKQFISKMSESGKN